MEGLNIKIIIQRGELKMNLQNINMIFMICDRTVVCFTDKKMYSCILKH
jgi:hypothetical protein